MKKNYQKPQMEAVNVNMSSQILTGSGVSSVAGGVFDGTVSGGSGTARSRYLDDWDEWE